MSDPYLRLGLGPGRHSVHTRDRAVRSKESRGPERTGSRVDIPVLHDPRRRDRNCSTSVRPPLPIAVSRPSATGSPAATAPERTRRRQRRRASLSGCPPVPVPGPRRAGTSGTGRDLGTLQSPTTLRTGHRKRQGAKRQETVGTHRHPPGLVGWDGVRGGLRGPDPSGPSEVYPPHRRDVESHPRYSTSPRPSSPTLLHSTPTLHPHVTPPRPDPPWTS